MILSEPVIQLGLAIVYISWPTQVIPYHIVWLYDKILWTSEPFWQLVEVIGTVQLITRFSHDVVERMDDQPTLAKGVLLTVAGTTYAITVYLISLILSSGSWACQIILFGVIGIWIVIHVYAFWSEKGIISETGLLSLFTVVVVYGMYVEKTAVENALEIPDDWKKSADESAYISLAFKVLTAGLDDFSRALSFCSHLITPWFILSGLFRVLAVLFTTELILTWYNETDGDVGDTENSYEDAEKEDLESIDLKTLYTKYSSPLIVRLVVYMVYGQFLVHHVHRILPGNESYIVTQFVQVIIATSLRLFQISGIFGLYVYHLCTRSDYVF